MSRKMTPECRTQQVEEVSRLWQEDPVYQEIKGWVAEAPGDRVRLVSKNPNYSQITGTVVVEMLAGEAQRLERELPNAAVLPNQPIEIIQPRKVTTSLKQDLTADDLWHLEAIGLHSKGQRKLTGAGKGITIGVLDTGVASTHRALRDRVVAGYNFNVEEWEVEPQNVSLDTDGHGTHVAGLICGSPTGVAPEAKVKSAAMLPNSHGSDANFILAIEWAAMQPDLPIVNISAGIRGYRPLMEKAIEKLLLVGVLPICAVGNEGRDKTRSPGNIRGVVSVGATNRRNRVAGFSSSGTLSVDNHQYNVPHLVAPGAAVYSSVIQGGYESWDGTSMATPIVAGVAALILEKYPDISVMDLREELMSNCQDLQQSSIRQGEGLVQVNS
ncbi:MAG: S8 family serine peptidase [Hormoscilla sp. GM7CHS1pb]|nr:S8 family serine peptidase [Hormoscilla sp. GM7CHS1pb]